MEMSERIEFYRATGEYGFLSNLYKEIPVTMDNDWKFVDFGRRMKMTYDSAEHAYQVAKAKDLKTKNWIKDAPDPSHAAIAGHGLLPWMIVKNWTEKKVERMREVLEMKFNGSILRQKLLDTGDAELVEDSKSDGFWGLGRVYKTAPYRRGKNMLGKMLMEIRADIREGLDE